MFNLMSILIIKKPVGMPRVKPKTAGQQYILNNETTNVLTELTQWFLHFIASIHHSTYFLLVVSSIFINVYIYYTYIDIFSYKKTLIILRVLMFSFQLNQI